MVGVFDDNSRQTGYIFNHTFTTKNSGPTERAPLITFEEYLNQTCTGVNSRSYHSLIHGESVSDNYGS